MREAGISRAAFFRAGGCTAGYVELGANIISVAVYEHKDLGIAVVKVSPEAHLNVCREALTTPWGYMAFVREGEDLCGVVLRKVLMVSRLLGSGVLRSNPRPRDSVQLPSSES